MTRQEIAEQPAPLEHVERAPWSFATLALLTGFTVGIIFRLSSVRKALRVYGLARKIM